MKVRIGVGIGTDVGGAPELVTVAGAVHALGFDSLWLSEVLTAPGVDPLVGLAWAGAVCPDLKLGTTMLLPGRNLVRLAKQVASVDALSGGRLLVTFVPGLPRGPERSAVGVAFERRGAVIEDALPVLRRLWAGETVRHSGVAGEFEDVRVWPRPAQEPFEVWLGGMAPAALRRCGALSDGWLPAFCTPAEAASGRVVVEASAAAAGRSISPEHFGVSIAYSAGPLDDRTTAALTARAKDRPLSEIVPVGLPAVRELVLAFLDVGFSKFVLRPLAAPGGWDEELALLAGAVADLQT